MKKHIRKIIGLILINTFMVAVSGTAIAADDFVPNEETIQNNTSNDFILDSDNTGGDITLQFGATLAETLKWDSANLRFVLSDDLRVEGNLATVGQEYIANDHSLTDTNGVLNLGRNAGAWENLTWNDAADQFELTDDLSVTGGITTTGITSIGNNTNTVSIDSTSWDISSTGAASGFTGFTSTGVIDFSGASRLALHQGAANPGTCTEGDIFYNSTDNNTYTCTALNTWTALSAGGADTFESVYAADADKVLTTSNANFTVNTGTADFIVTSNDWGVDALGNITTAGTVDGVDLSALAFSDIATRVKEISLEPDFDGAVIEKDGTLNKGKLIYDFIDGGGTDKRNFYDWTTKQAAQQDIDLVVSLQLPLDFVSFTGTPLSVNYRTSDGVTATNKVDVAMYDTAGAAVALTGASNLANANWTTANITFGGGETFTAGSNITLVVKLSSTNAGWARVSDIVLNYNGR